MQTTQMQGKVKYAVLAAAASLAMLFTQPAQATSGCSLAVSGNPKVTAQYGITITVFGATSYTVIGPGSTLTVLLEEGDMVRVQAANYTCGSLLQLQWGFTTWTACDQSGAPSAVFMGGIFTVDYYVAHLACMCPAPGYGTLNDLYSGVQCMPNSGGGGQP